MSHKSVGINGERELVHAFWARGWAAIRVAGSGSQRYPAPDLLVGNRNRRLAIEAKVCGEDNKYIEKQDIADLKEFTTKFGAEPWVAVKFQKTDWLFITLDDLEETEKSFAANIETAKRRGLLIDEVVK